MPTTLSEKRRKIVLSAALDAIASELDNYHLMHAARGTLLRQLGHREAALAAFERAAQLAGTEAEQRFLVQQIEELAEDALKPRLASPDR